MQCAELQAHVTAVRAERGFTTGPLHLLGHLMEELGEVARALKPAGSRNYGDFSEERLVGELADVNVLLNALAQAFAINLEAATLVKLDADGDRDWPSTPH